MLLTNTLEKARKFPDYRWSMTCLFRILSLMLFSSIVVSPAHAQAPVLAVKVEAFRAKAKVFEETIKSVGTMRANESVTLVAETSLRLTKICFTEGAEVKSGELLFQLDDAQLQSELKEIEARLALATANRRRAEELLPSKAVSQLDADFAAAEAQSCEAQRQTKLVQLSRTKIVAPFSGRLGTRKVSEGAFLTPAISLVELQDLSQIKIDFTLPERYALAIAEKQPFSFTVAGQGEVRHGEISVIEPAIDPQTRSLVIRGLCTKPQGLRPGGFVDVTLTLGGDQKSLVVPSQAIVPSPRGHGVYVIDSGKARFQDVTIGTRTEQSVQILRGLAEGDVIATTNLNRIRPGVGVSIVNQP